MKPRARVAAAALMGVAGLVGCASTSTPARFHTLMPPVVEAAPAARPAPALRAEVMPVTLPVQVDVAPIVVRLPDDSMRALEHERWIAPLADEIRSALALRIDAALAAAPATPTTAAPWRVALEVQRFDSTLGGAAGLQALWSLQQAGGSVVLRCQVNDREPVAAGAVALVSGHRSIVGRLGDAIGRAVRAAANGGTPACA
ncbi:MAG TPA: ABC-type transport auxiliary lipoprotein family protein [Burkholderiaceae bacterium]|nr:ABC-type transport auxiliary lipoprotein family protein [Burkholderiaceae bacterium]